VTGGDWAWRRRIRSNAHSYRIYRIVVGVVGAIIVATGLVLVPFPGPGWLIVFLGVGVWASEFAWAHRLLQWAKERLHAWNVWMKRQPAWLAVLVGALTVAALLALVYGYLASQGVPGFVPDALSRPVETYLGL
jgi:uncharacterized protein (TIGR02611 family)